MQRKKTFSNILITVSWGPDSMFLATFMIRLFQEYKIPMKHLFLVHCNHKTRPETDQEEQFVRNYFKQQQLFIVQKPTNIKTTEAALRNRRYQEWKTIMENHNIPKILLGHHFDDRVETTLLNLLRGCRIPGFIGMKSEESHHLLWWRTVCRPLLNYHKQDILEWCKKLAIPYVIDQSNQKIQTSLRNKIRIKYLPLLYAEKSFESTLRKLYTTYEENQTTIPLQAINQCPYRNADWAYKIQCPKEELTKEWVAQLLKQLHASSSMTSGTIDDLWRFLTKSENGWKYLQWITFFVAHHYIYVIKAPERFRQKTIDKQEQIATHGESIRYPQSGDHYKGKTRNKYCINQKIPLFRRNFIPLLVKDGKILKMQNPFKIM